MFTLAGSQPTELARLMDTARAANATLASISHIDRGVPVYAPGSPSPRDARPVRIEPGFDAYGVDIAFAHEPGVRVSGTIVDATGGPLVGSVTLRVSHRSGDPAPPARTVPLAPDGTFQFTNVPPGDYVVRASARARLERRTPDASGRVQTMIGLADETVGTAFATVSGDADVGVTIRTATGSRVTGRLILEGDRAAATSSFQFEAVPADRDRSAWIGGPRARVSPAGTFETRGLIGPMRLRLAQAPPGWYLKSALINGIDAAEYPVTIDTDRLLGEVLVIVAPGGEITGQVVDDRREPARDYSVIVFSTDPTRWWEGSPWVRLARSSYQGPFSVDGLPPGEYWIAAVEHVQGDAGWGEWQDPGLLNRLVAGARRVQVGEGAHVATELRLTPLIR